ncbi:MAG: hypothetical protein ACP5N0_09040 [Methanosarcina sp.]|uniref:hypothetical protein n=1 Tax=Methanosarcina sp. TaxID=2213 RepID=UPI003BB51D92
MSEADLKSEPKAENMSEMAENFKKGVLIIAMLLLFVATFQLYFSIEKIIDTWFQYQYASIFKAVYYLFVLVVSLYIIRLYILKR